MPDYPPLLPEQLLQLYRWMVMAREIDLLERAFCQRGEAFFTVGSMGHEGSVALAPHLTDADWLNPHYRDKALLLARGMPPSAFFDALFGKNSSHCRGRQLPDMFGDPQLHLLSMSIPVGNSALPSVGFAHTLKERGRGLVYCGCGDGGTQQGEWMEAVAAAVRDTLPVLFLIQDNHYAISTKTVGRTFYSLPKGLNPQWFGLPIHHLDGTAVEASVQALAGIVSEIRETRGPALAVMHVERLCDHSNADNQTHYRDLAELAEAQQSDPIRKLEQTLRERGVDESSLNAIRTQARMEAEAAAALSQQGADAESSLAVKRPIAPLFLDTAATEASPATPALTMAESIRETLRLRLRGDPAIQLYGEDIEDPKGDVFKVTLGLSSEFPGRVVNSPLSESSIVGLAVGWALAGKRPVAFIQFADFFPLVYNQLYNEAASLYWRTGEQYEAPLVLMVSCGGYRPGLGPFHAASMEAIAAHIPGIDVVMPSNADDAAGLLNTVLDQRRPTVFFYPKNALHNRELASTLPPASHRVPLGKARLAKPGRELTMVAWGNTVAICEQAALLFEQEAVFLEILDLRSISPWDEEAVLQSAHKTGRLLVVHEDNHTAGFGAEILATVAEKIHRPIHYGRLAREDTFIPYHFANQLAVLPSLKRVVEKTAAMLKMAVNWEKPAPADQAVFLLEAIGASPSDETVELIEWRVKPGDTIAPGMIVAVFEASKAIMDLESPVLGTVEDILAPSGASVKVGTPILSIHLQNPKSSNKPISREDAGIPRFSKPRPTPSQDRRVHILRERRRNLFAGIGAIAYATGSKPVDNTEILAHLPDGHSVEEIERLTGIVQRPRLAEGEDALTLAVAAAREALAACDLEIADIDLVICSTGTPLHASPSLACQILGRLSEGEKDVQPPAYDLSAACSGYLYGLLNAYDFLYGTPRGHVLLITAETLSLKTDPADFATAPLFGDAATATIVLGGDHTAKWQAMMYRPVISAKPDNGGNLIVPTGFDRGEFIQMKGHRVFQEAVRSMMSIMKKACHDASLTLDQLDCIVPHQANQRIMDALQEKLSLADGKIYSNIQQFGNTSSCSIPIGLKQVLASRQPGERIGLCTFGGGFTFGAGILETTDGFPHE